MSSPLADKAIKLLEQLGHEIGPSGLVFFVTPNVILSLAGTRGFCDGVYYNEDNNILNGWVAEMKAGIKALGTITDVFFAESQIDTTPGQDLYAGFDLILKDGLSYTLHKTALLTTDPQATIDSKVNGEQLVDEIMHVINDNPIFKGISEEKQRDAAVGILLGYPDKAIEGLVKLWEEDDTFAEGFIEADIRGAAYYSCPQPVYEYPRHLVNDEQITTHERLWSSILSDYYHSDFHKNLEKKPEFIAKAKQLDLYP